MTRMRSSAGDRNADLSRRTGLEAERDVESDAPLWCQEIDDARPNAIHEQGER